MLDPVDLLEGLVGRASPSGREAAAVEFLVAQLRRAGFEAHADAAGNAVGYMGDGQRRVLLLGHIDTVAGEIPVRRAGDMLYGRGTVDAKGPLAAFVAAAALGPVPGLHLTVVGAVGEEADSPGAIYLRDHAPPPDYLIIGEPSRWDRLTLGYKGSAWYKLEVKRPAAHTAADEPSACEEAVAVWRALQAWCEQANAGREGLFQRLTPTLRAMNSESDGLAEHVELRVGFRLPPSISPEALHEAVQAVVGRQAQVRVLRGAVPAYRAEKNNALVRAALAAVRAEGGEPSFVLKSGSSDMNIVAPAWHSPVIAYGPGDSQLDHTPREHISIAEYLRSVRVLRRTLENLETRPSAG